jgi:hypothetical protein
VDDVDAELLGALAVAELWLALLPQPAANRATAKTAATTNQARRTAL